ncbi:MAG: class I SAM-dependent methyltransferase [Bacteroidota bacterium]
MKNTGFFSRIFSHVSSGASTGGYYSSMNKALMRLNNEYTMLHYPFYGSESDSFLDAQANLTDYCLSLLPDLGGKALLEVGCGNGVQAIYILEKFAPGEIKGIDLNQGNIDIARDEAEKKGLDRISFQVDDAHALSTVEDNSVDVVINIESAFHYPDKPAFLSQVHRVLKPGGAFVIADILVRKDKSDSKNGSWRNKMSYHHWPMSSYETEFQLKNFKMESTRDITPEVIRGFRSYRRWLRDMQKIRFVEDLLMKLYYTIHTRLNIYLLRTSRRYCVFVGSKAL